MSATHAQNMCRTDGRRFRGCCITKSTRPAPETKSWLPQLLAMRVSAPRSSLNDMHVGFEFRAYHDDGS